MFIEKKHTVKLLVQNELLMIDWTDKPCKNWELHISQLLLGVKMFKIEPYEIITINGIIEWQTNLTYAIASARPARHPHRSRSRYAFAGLFVLSLGSFFSVPSSTIRLHLTSALLKCLVYNQLIPVQKCTEIYRILSPQVHSRFCHVTARRVPLWGVPSVHFPL